VKLTLTTSLAGLADSATFAVTRRETLRAHPGRAAGTAAAAVLWAALAQSAATGARSRARRLAALNLAANGAMLGAHLRARVSNPRVVAGTALAAAALLGTLGRD
jgi:hypothetical protein